MTEVIVRYKEREYGCADMKELLEISGVEDMIPMYNEVVFKRCHRRLHGIRGIQSYLFCSDSIVETTPILIDIDRQVIESCIQGDGVVTHRSMTMPSDTWSNICDTRFFNGTAHSSIFYDKALLEACSKLISK